MSDFNFSQETFPWDIRETTIQRFEAILDNILNFLQRIAVNQSLEMEKEYYYFIEQDAEKIIEMPNYAILSLEHYQKVKDIFTILIGIVEQENFKSTFAYFGSIIYDLYFIFKYIYESFLFLIENEYLEEFMEDT